MLTSIAAVFIGMTTRPDPPPNVFGSLLGVAVLGVLANRLNLVGVSPYRHQVPYRVHHRRRVVGLPKLVGGRR